MIAIYQHSSYDIHIITIMCYNDLLQSSYYNYGSQISVKKYYNNYVMIILCNFFFLQIICTENLLQLFFHEYFVTIFSE